MVSTQWFQLAKIKATSLFEPTLPTINHYFTSVLICLIFYCISERPLRPPLEGGGGRRRGGSRHEDEGKQVKKSLIFFLKKTHIFKFSVSEQLRCRWLAPSGGHPDLPELPRFRRTEDGRQRGLRGGGGR